MNNIEKLQYHSAIFQIQIAVLKSVLSPVQRELYDVKLEAAKLAFKAKHPNADNELWDLINEHMK